MLSRFFEKPPLVAETDFAKFIRSASSAEKKRVYARVLERATQRQLDVIKAAKNAHTAGAQ